MTVAQESRMLDQLNKIQLDEQYRIEAMFLRSVDRIGDDEYDYIQKKIERKFYITENSHFLWIRDLASFYRKLYNILQDHLNKKKELPARSAQVVGSALLYFINPYDFFPDFTREFGYVDDLYVLLLCLNMISNQELLVELYDYPFKE